MPLLKLQLSKTIPEEKKKGLLAAVAKICATLTGKPEQYTMVTLEQAVFHMAGEAGEAAYVDIRGIGGLTPEVNKKLSKALCDLLNDEIKIASNRVYITFTDVAAKNWGWNGGTFG